MPEDGHIGGDVYSWKQLYGGLMPSEVKKLRQLEEENTRFARWWPI
jgi:hypothetical protein